MWKESLKRMKVESGLTTAEIAKGAEIPEPTLEKLFAGVTKDPKLPTMQKLVHFLGYTLDDLYPEEKKTPAPSEDGAGEKFKKVDIETVLVSLGFVQDGHHITDADLRFINGVLDIIDAWFEDRNQKG